MNDIYEECKAAYDEMEPQLFSICTESETQIDISKTIETFNFIDKSICIMEEITEDTARNVVNLIRFWNAAEAPERRKKANPIVIYIDTPGGSLNATFSMIAAIEMSEVPIYTVNLGRAWSGGFFLLISGHKKFATPYCSYLFHEGSSIMGGDAHKALQEADFYRYQLSQLKDITLQKTDITEEQYDKHKKDDWWFSNKTALKYKVIDDILTDFSDLNKNIEDNDEEEVEYE